MSSKSPLAVVTMVHNEKELLPVWVRHYTRQVGAQHCYILDHGSNDGSSTGLAVNVIRWPRCPHDEHLRAIAASDFCASLLYAYDRVLFTDGDEIVVADPSIFTSLTDFVQRGNGLGPVIAPFGVDVLQDHLEEGELDWSQPITWQRRWIRPFSSLSKPTLIAKRVEWAAGFHYCRQVPMVPIPPHLYLFHLAFSDNTMLYERQIRRNTVQKMQQDHHQVPPKPLLDHIMADMERLPRTKVRMEAGNDEFERVKKHYAAELPYHRFIQAQDLWELPSRFRGVF